MYFINTSKKLIWIFVQFTFKYIYILVIFIFFILKPPEHEISIRLCVKLIELKYIK